MTGITKLEKLKRQWQTITGEPMPPEFDWMPVEKIQRAIQMVLAGTHVFVPAMTQRQAESGESLMDWDTASPG